ncbi:MAG: carbohydrate kinase family protein [Bacillota bacterium]|nr:carbohydrate kinase family protein [Bacillota bacterium]
MKILCAGQIVADILACPIEKVDFNVDTCKVDQIKIRSGGDAQNVAVDLARLGNHVGFCGCVGDDLLGSFLLNTLLESGVYNEYISILPDVSTSSCLCIINKEGDRSFFYYGGANEIFSEEQVTDTMLSAYDHLHVGGVFLLPSFDGEGTAGLLARARNMGLTTSMDITWDVNGRWSQLIGGVYRYLDIFFPSIKEAEKLAETDSVEEMANFFLENGVGTVVIKLGKSGCYTRNRQQSFFSNAFQVEATDTTGAGDAFVAGFLTAMGQGSDYYVCSQWGNAVAAHAVSSLGATDGVPDRRTIENWLAERNIKDMERFL